jgi:hydroxymethylpyrimidine pyrophosphatase-like HAD family hydrolase
VSNCTVAVANAAPEVLEAADEVTAANTEDGVALLLERILAANGAAPSGPRPPAPGTETGR